MSERTRPRTVYAALSEQEYAELKAIQRAIGQTHRFFLLLGARHARTIWEGELRRERPQAT